MHAISHPSINRRVVFYGAIGDNHRENPRGLSLREKFYRVKKHKRAKEEGRGVEGGGGSDARPGRETVKWSMTAQSHRAFYSKIMQQPNYIALVV